MGSLDAKSEESLSLSGDLFTAKLFAKHLSGTYRKHEANLVDDLQGLLRKPLSASESPHGVANAQLSHIRDLACGCNKNFWNVLPIGDELADLILHVSVHNAVR